MGKFALITKLGPSDIGVSINSSEYQMSANLKILVNGDASEIKLDTFFKELRQLKLEPNEIAMDLLIIASSMYAADTRIDRTKFSDDSWTREIELFIPVSEPNIWNNQKDRLKQIFRFLTGDIWEITYRHRTEFPVISPRGNRKKYKMPYPTDTVCLFSGGMDSFIGAMNLISGGNSPLLLGHAKSADVSPNQKYCEAALRQAFPQQPLKRIYAFLRVPKKELFNSEEKTERGRSFLFLTLGAICASSLCDKSNLFVPENGLISLNLPLTPLRVGSHSTRTTHPYYLSKMQDLFNDLGLGVSIKNPYQFKTKGEMVAECADPNLVLSTQTMSCSHPAGRHGEGTKHCGYCVPCLIRKAAFLKANLTEVQTYKVNIHNKADMNSESRRDNVIALKYLIEKISQKPNYLKTLIRSTGPLGDDIDGYLEVYQKGLQEVETLIRDVNL